MNVYIWNEVEQCSDNYHSKGGVVVISESESEARSLANSKDGCNIAQNELPDEVIACDSATSKKVFIFPNAGCC